MNVQEMAPLTLGHYAETACGFTFITVYIIIAFQSKHILGEDVGFWKRLGWPYLLFKFHRRITGEQDLES